MSDSNGTRNFTGAVGGLDDFLKERNDSRVERAERSADAIYQELGIHNKMHDDPSYKRTKHPETGEEIGRLGYQCGSHCGVVTVGHATEKVGHCPCADCHNGRPA